MSSNLEIVNGTLALMAQVPVSNVNDTDKSLIISNNVDRYHQDLLRREMWDFALKFFFSDTPLTHNLSPEFLYNYELPSDYGRYFRTQLWNSVQFGFRYVIMDAVIMTSSRPVGFYYLVNNCDLSVVSIPYEQALIAYLASIYTYPLTNNEKLAMANEMLWQRYLGDAVQQNNMELEIAGEPYNSYQRNSYI